MSSVTANASYYTGGKDIDQRIDGSIIHPSNSDVLPNEIHENNSLIIRNANEENKDNSIVDEMAAL